MKFPVKLDVFEFCTPDLQQRLTPVRVKFKEMEDIATAEADRKKTAVLGGEGEGDVTKGPDASTMMETDESKIEYEPVSFPDGKI